MHEWRCQLFWAPFLGQEKKWVSFLGHEKNESLSLITKRMSLFLGSRKKLASSFGHEKISLFDLREKKENMKESSCQWSSRLLGSVWQSQSTMIAQSFFLQLMEKVKEKGSLQSGPNSILFPGIFCPLHFWFFHCIVKRANIVLLPCLKWKTDFMGFRTSAKYLEI